MGHFLVSGGFGMRKQTIHSMRMLATDAAGKEYSLDVFHERTITKDAKGKDVVTSGPGYVKTDDGLDAEKIADGKYRVIATGVELTLKGPEFVAPKFPLF